MAFDTTLFFNISTGRFVLSPSTPTDLPSPSWYNGDTKHLVLQFVKNADAQGKVSVVPASGTGLQIGIGVPGSSPLGTVTAPPAVSDVFTVDLPLTGAGVGSALTGKTSVDVTLEFRTTAGGQSQRYQTPVRIQQQVLSDTVTDTPLPDVAIGRADALATFVPKTMSAGDYMIWTSPDGTLRARVYLGNNGTLQAEPLS